MNLSELIEQLQDLQHQYGDTDPEVRIASQPSWPLANHISCLTTDTDATRDNEDEEESIETEVSGGEVLWIAAQQGNCSDSPYAPKGAWEGSY